jgi:folate-binding protein YgfZ
MATNSIQALTPGQGCYNFLLSAQGRIQADCTIYREDSPQNAATPEFLLSTSSSQAETIHRHLDHFIIMDDVELTPAFADQVSLVLLGPEAPRRLAELGLPAAEPLRLVHADTPHGSILLLTPSAPRAAAVPRFELRAAPPAIDALRARLLESGVAEVSAAALECLRILEATPRFGQDIRDRDLPQETGQAQALHFAKGCYLGQEIVERIRSRGQVHRTFVQFRLNGSMETALAGNAGTIVPAMPATLEAGGKPAGELTSAAFVPLPDGPALLALGYTRREILETHQPLTYSGGSAEPLSLASKR